MGIFDNLFGKKSPGPAPSQGRQAPARPEAGQPPVKPPTGPASAPGAVPPPTIKVWDNYGRPLEIPGDDWRTFLPDSFKKSWNAPDELANLIVTCLRDGFATEGLAGAWQLHRIDPKPHRGAILLGATLLDLKRFPEAEKILKEDLQRHGEDGTVLTNLAKAFSGLGDQSRAERALWRGLEVDPNQPNGLLWYANIQRERGGPAAELAAFRRVAALPASWRAQLWLARDALESKDVPAALGLYREALLRLKPATADALMQISGDLGNNGLVKEVIELCGPLFEAREHGMQVGNNLIKAYVDLHDAPSARRILEQLYAQQRPDWREHLLFWEGEIDKLDKGYGPVSESAKIEIQLLALEGPIWALAGTPFSEMLPVKPSDSVKVAFFCGSAALPPTGHGDKVISQPSDAIGQFTRSLPMFLAERMHIKTSASVITLVPWLKSGGFVLAGGPWTIEALAASEQKPDYVVFLHVIAKEEPWQAKFTILRVIDEKIVAGWEQIVDPKDAAAGINAIARRTLAEFHSLANVSRSPAPDFLFPPTVGMLPQYVSGLAQALAVFSAAFAPDTHPFLYAERNILDWLLDLCLRETDNVIMRMLLLSTVERESRARPDIAREYRDRLERLQREHPLRPSAQGLTDAALSRIYSD